MKFTVGGVFKKCLFVILFVFFLMKLHESKRKLDMEMIGSTSSVQSARRIKYPSISICQSRMDKMERYKFNGVDPPKFNTTPDLSDFLGIQYFNDTSQQIQEINMLQNSSFINVHHAIKAGNCYQPNCFYIVPCFTFDAPNETPTGWENAPYFNLTIPGSNVYFFVYNIFIHNRDQMYLMSTNNVFGSDALTLSRPGQGDGSINYTYAKTYKLKQIHWKAIDHEDQRCDEENTEGYTSKCITEFLETTIGCNMNLQGSKLGLEICNKASQMIKYAEWNKQLVQANETEIFNLTGCLSTCDMYEYSAQPMIDTVIPSQDSIFKLGFVFQSGRHELKKQYIIYDWNSCFADVGGYLGLLLGQSIYGIYETMSVLLIKMANSFKPKMNNKTPITK